MESSPVPGIVHALPVSVAQYVPAVGTAMSTCPPIDVERAAPHGCQRTRTSTRRWPIYAPEGTVRPGRRRGRPLFPGNGPRVAELNRETAYRFLRL